MALHGTTAYDTALLVYGTIQFVYVKYALLFFVGMLFSGGRDFFRALSAAWAGKRDVGTLRRVSGSQPNPVAVLSSIQRR